MIEKDRFHEADRLLDAALDLPAAERPAFLKEKCGDDRELQDLVGRLLRQVDETTSRRLRSFPRSLLVTIAVRDQEEFQRALESFRGYLDQEARKKEESSLASEFLNEFLKKRKE